MSDEFSKSETDSNKGTTSTKNPSPNTNLINVNISKIFMADLLLLIMYLWQPFSPFDF